MENLFNDLWDFIILIIENIGRAWDFMVSNISILGWQLDWSPMTLLASGIIFYMGMLLYKKLRP